MKITKSRLIEMIKEEAASYDDATHVEEGILDLFKQKSAEAPAKGEPELKDLIVKAIRQSHGESMGAIERMTHKFNERIAAIEKELKIRTPAAPEVSPTVTQTAPGLKKDD